ncbi:hypothetical protein [Hydrocarboniphaga sp.]|jgi:NAD(P)-dependent dehydrogenase (short-subunit alcohol dehydrogenase family)|nr:hypothetical protein [Hydrocarboniphaga sp.]MDZ4078483.1 hypothetical protein [Hydrocarboniphaga sp.]
MNEQTKRLALVTGGASGIARAAAREGLRVVIADVDEAASECRGGSRG